jgi:hypothetical protein
MLLAALRPIDFGSILVLGLVWTGLAALTFVLYSWLWRAPRDQQ